MSADHAPLALSELQRWVSSQTYEWLKEGDEKEEEWQQELEDGGANQISNLFHNDDDSSASDEDYEGSRGRIRVWSSSTTNVNGVGGVYGTDDDSIDQEPGSICVVYVLSESWEGYGDKLWASSRHLANQFADPIQCNDLLSPLSISNESKPLEGLTVLELGAGCGVPSLVAIQSGASHVVCTDLDDPNRIRCIAESMERNSRQESVELCVAKACPYRWGQPAEPVLECLGHEAISRRFDVVCATDCLFMPWLYDELIESIDKLLAANGVAILAFCIHEGFSKQEEVWPFVDKAQGLFHVEILKAVQLEPPRKGMDQKQGLVNTLRLTRKQA